MKAPPHFATAWKTLALAAPSALWIAVLFVHPARSLRVLFLLTAIANLSLLVTTIAVPARQPLWRQLRLPAIGVVIALNLACLLWGRRVPIPLVD